MAPAPLVLVVDDYDDAREMYAELLELSGYRVAQAADGQHALELARALLPALILMDLSLPVLDGWEATRQLKADARTCAIPVLALSGTAALAETPATAATPWAAVLSKPCLPETLLREVERVLLPLPPGAPTG